MAKRRARRTPVALPRIWVDASGALEPGANRRRRRCATAVAAVAPLAAGRLPGRVRTVRAEPDELTLVLRSGARAPARRARRRCALKLRVARRVLPLLEAGTAYVDVSVPERPVAGTDLNSQVEVESRASTTP